MIFIVISMRLLTILRQKFCIDIYTNFDQWSVMSLEEIYQNFSSFKKVKLGGRSQESFGLIV